MNLLYLSSFKTEVIIFNTAVNTLGTYLLWAHKLYMFYERLAFIELFNIQSNTCTVAAVFWDQSQNHNIKAAFVTEEPAFDFTSKCSSPKGIKRI